MLTIRQQTEINKLIRFVDQQMGDKGSCVLGYKMYINGELLCPQPWQGSLSCGRFYELAKEFLISEGIDPSTIHIDYGRID
jgi:hypothetical protein